MSRDKHVGGLRYDALDIKGAETPAERESALDVARVAIELDGLRDRLRSAHVMFDSRDGHIANAIASICKAREWIDRAIHSNPMFSTWEDPK